MLSNFHRVAIAKSRKRHFLKHEAIEFKLK